LQRSGAEIRTWQHWRRFLEKYDKSDLIDHMLGEPLTLDHGDGGSAADRLIGLVHESGIELFHDPDQHGWASVRVDGHWENPPIRSRPFQLFLLRTYYRETATAPARTQSAPHWTFVKREPCLTVRNLPSICGSQVIERNSISTYVIAPGGRSRSIPMVGG
jgi:hypothetical protein